VIPFVIEVLLVLALGAVALLVAFVATWIV